MKIKNVVILILLLIICGQFIQSFLLLKKFNTLRFTFEHQPVEVYVAGLTESLKEVDPLIGEITSQHHWLSKRLYKCIELLEQQKGLKAIPMEYPVGYPMPGFTHPMGPLYSQSDPNTLQPYMTESVPFYEDYTEPSIPPLENIKESDIQRLKCRINLQTLSLNMYLNPCSKARIENYEKRLKRLEEHWNR